MGVIQRQSIKSSIVDYAGVILGVISTLFIYPLDWELYGNIQYWFSSAVILTPFLTQGSTSLINKFFPYFKEHGIKGFLGLILIITTLTISIMSLLILGFTWIFSDFEFISTALEKYKNLFNVYCLAILMIYFAVFQLQSANARRIVVPNLVSKIGVKLITSLLVLFGYLGYIGNHLAAPVLLVFYVTVIGFMIIYLSKLDKLDIRDVEFSKISKSMRKKMFNYWLFGGLNLLGGILAFKIDVFMIGTFVDKTSVGFYSILLFMVNLMIIPMNQVNQISGPIISESFEKKDINTIGSIYTKSSNSLLAFGTFVFLFVWLNIYFVLDIMKNGEDLIPFASAALFLGFAKIFDLMTSVNNVIIIYSKYYKYNLLFLMIMSAINIGLNFVLIEKFGITGAAIATGVSLFLLNALKTIFVYLKLGIHPFSKKTLIILATLVCGLILVTLFQRMIIYNGLVSLVIYSSILASITIPLFYKLELSKELNNVFKQLLQLLKK